MHAQYHLASPGNGAVTASFPSPWIAPGAPRAVAMQLGPGWFQPSAGLIFQPSSVESAISKGMDGEPPARP